MFVQFIEGPVSDKPRLKRQYAKWLSDLAPGADGWLGSVAGVTDDGTGFIAARFESEDAARRNSDRDAQGTWWEDTEACFSGAVRFTDCSDVELFGDGGSDDAGFVQVIRGRMHNMDAARKMMREAEQSDGFRPDVIGGYVGMEPDGAYTQVVYFTSEEEAREGERKEAEQGDDFAERMADLHDGPPRYLDLRNPWLASAR